MIKNLLFVFLLCLSQSYAQTSISDARAMSAGTTVTITGITTNGSELGAIRYIEDGTAGIAIYPGTGSVAGFAPTRGSEITVTGTLKMYNNLLELDPVTSFTINSTNNVLPTPQVITPSQFSESREGELVTINGATFSTPGGNFAVNTNYTFTANSQSGVVRITGSSNTLIGQPVPSGPVSITGILSQFCSSPATGCVTGYQLLPRESNDIVQSAAIYFTSLPAQSNITTTSFTLDWNTNISGSTFVKYGVTPALELGFLASQGTGTSHTFNFSSGSAGNLYYIQALSVNGSDTAKSLVRPYATESNSSGSIKIYFNKTVDNSVSTGTNAIQLLNLIDDTLISYINRAKYTLDLCIYSLDNTGMSDISAAINNAYTRGVNVRIITEGGNANTGLNSLNSGINVLKSPTSISYGLMHNKFVSIDAFSSDPDDAILWTGSTNLTDNQINSDANNVIIFQDQSIAKGYTLEFEEMWGSNTLNYSTTNSKFGPFKTDNTPHEYKIGGKRIEQYFSPSDGVNSRLLEKINSAGNSLLIETMLITRNDLTYAITDKVNAGVTVYGLVDNTSSTTTWSTLSAAMGSNLRDNTPGVLHHKSMIVDHNNTSSDPLVWTGSHNWSNSADQKNDENTVVVHDATIANIYYQEFIARFVQSGGTVGVNEKQNDALIKIYPNPSQGSFNVYLAKTENNVQFQLFDVTGKNISKVNVTTSGSNLWNLQTSELSSGVYFLKINAGNQLYTRQLFIY